MKILTFTFILIILLFSNAFAQIDTSSLSYYPLNDGDYWEYVEIITDHSVSPIMTYYRYRSHEVIGDTLFPKNKLFKIIKRKTLRTTDPPYYYFERIDSTSCNVYSYETYSNIEYLIDSLKSQIGDSCKATRTHPFENHNTICISIGPDSILNTATTSKNFEEKHWHAPIEYKLSKGFGLIYMHFYFDFGTYTKHLLYARINGTEYGTRVNSLQRDNNPQIVNEFRLYQNYPNPFNPRTNIQFSIPKQEFVTLKIFNLQGKEVATLVSDNLHAGLHTFTWEANDVSSGVYIIRLQGNNQSRVKKCLLLK